MSAADGGWCALPAGRLVGQGRDKDSDGKDQILTMVEACRYMEELRQHV